MLYFQCWTIPIRLQSEANIRDKHWYLRHRRNKKYIEACKFALLIDPIRVSAPMVLTFIRIAPRGLDFDNLAYAFKSIRDFICDQIIPGLKAGRADASDLLVIKYAQEVGKPRQYAVKIVMDPLKKDLDSILNSEYKKI
jgi:hypothetical protein